MKSAADALAAYDALYKVPNEDRYIIDGDEAQVAADLAAIVRSQPDAYQQGLEDRPIIDAAVAAVWQAPELQPEGEVIPSMAIIDILRKPEVRRAVRTIIGDSANPHHGRTIDNAGDVAEAVLKALTEALEAGIEAARAKAEQEEGIVVLPPEIAAALQQTKHHMGSWLAGHIAAGSHKPTQHRDGMEPWCNVCGLNAVGKKPEDRFEKRLAAEEANDRAKDWLARQEQAPLIEVKRSDAVTNVLTQFAAEVQGITAGEIHPSEGKQFGYWTQKILDALAELEEPS